MIEIIVHTRTVQLDSQRGMWLLMHGSVLLPNWPNAEAALSPVCTFGLLRCKPLAYAQKE